ncbi:MAG: O-antigen ligase family protein [Campylobacterales bacterium]|nr:O-antigen ligase family protein [Campylobacterales bacterium]
MSFKSYFYGEKLEKLTFYSLVLCFFAIPFSRATISFMVFWLPVLVVLNYGFKGGVRKTKESLPLMILFSFVAYMTLSLLWTTDYATGFDQLQKSYFLLVLVLCVGILGKKEWAKPLFFALLSALFLSALLSLGHFFEFWNIKGKTSAHTSPWMNSIHYSIFMAIGAIASLNLMFSVQRKFFFGFMFVIFVTTLLLSNGRTGQLAFFVAMIVCFWFYFKNSKFYFFGAVLLIIFSSLGAYFLVDEFGKRIDRGLGDIVQIQEGEYNTSWGLRAAYWVLAKEIVAKEPLFGVGVGDYKLASGEVLTEDNLDMSSGAQEFLVRRHFHNQYLMAVVQGGFVGLTLFLAFLGSLLLVSFKESTLKPLCVSLFVVYAVGFIAEPLLLLQNPLSLFAVLAGLLAVLKREQSLDGKRQAKNMNPVDSILLDSH